MPYWARDLAQTGLNDDAVDVVASPEGIVPFVEPGSAPSVPK
jgi:hypothetical protein